VRHSEFAFKIPAIAKLRLNSLRKNSVQNPWSVLLGGSPRIYVAEGALQRPGKRSALIARFSAGDREITGLKPISKSTLFRWTKVQPLLKQGASTKSLPQSFFAACEAASVKQGGSPKLWSELYVTDKAGRLHLA
jgi:hypothetical protein